ncbi:MAG: T9SS type A sorting domain-containing protein [Calditrichaeota bacterium]|nr:T9SS type A sorting domain-containing protein [Calditrichota bacterium]
MSRLFSFLTIILLVATVAFAGNISKGIRISYNITDNQIQFIDSHFDFVMTPFLSHEIRQSFQKPKLLLYRSIQGTWEGFNQFDWAHIDSNENMFCHSDSANLSPATRILTRWNSWLMDGNDLVNRTAGDAMNHWVNYYAVTASSQVYSYNYDGLFIDSAGHKLGETAVYGNMPWNYSPDTWRDGRYAALQFIKSYLPDKTVIFNGLHSDNGADSSLTFTDGGMWEDFVYDIDNGSYKGGKKWWDAIQCMQNNHDDSYLVLVVKKPGLIDDIQARIFSVASYLLVSNSNVVLSLSDWSHQVTVQYYPEYDLSLGDAAEDFYAQEDSLFIRKFEHGLVIVNPYASSSKVFSLEKEYQKIIPIGGGVVDSAGFYDGYLSYETINGDVEIPPISGLILKDSLATTIKKNPPSAINDFALSQNYPNPFNSSTTIRYQLARAGRVEIAIYNVLGEKIRSLVNEEKQSGTHSVVWDGKDDTGNLVSTGVYFYQLRVNDTRSYVRKLSFLK